MSVKSKKIGSGGDKYTHYAVSVGRRPGIYPSWILAAPQVTGYSQATYKGFNNLEGAKAYMREAKIDDPLIVQDPLIANTGNVFQSSELTQGSNSRRKSNCTTSRIPTPSPAKQFLPIDSEETDLKTIVDAKPTTPKLSSNTAIKSSVVVKETKKQKTINSRNVFANVKNNKRHSDAPNAIEKYTGAAQSYHSIN